MADLNAKDLKNLFNTWANVMGQNKDYLIELDSHVGDSDLGLTMSDGFKAASVSANEYEDSDLGKMCYQAGKAMSNAVPSTMGTLMASGLMAAGKELKGVDSLDAEGIYTFFKAYFDGVQNRGKAQIGEKTFLDGLAGAVESLKQDAEQGVSQKDAALHAADAAHQGFLNTKGMLAQHGRAGGRGEQSRELLDPGAAVADLLMKGYAEFVLSQSV